METDDGDALSDLNRLLEGLDHLDDRTLVLALAAFMEETLKRLLLAHLVDCKQSRDLVDGFDAPLGTLSARIKAAYALGLLSEPYYRDLEALRRVRNKFAHNWRGISLGDSDLRALIGTMGPGVSLPSAVPEAPRSKLRGAISTIAIALNIHVKALQRGTTPRLKQDPFVLGPAVRVKFLEMNPGNAERDSS